MLVPAIQAGDNWFVGALIPKGNAFGAGFEAQLLDGDVFLLGYEGLHIGVGQVAVVAGFGLGCCVHRVFLLFH
jgi:hypothetical protein